MKTKSISWLLALIVLFGLAARIATVLILDFAPTSDYAAYQAMALNFLAGKGIIDTAGNFAMYNVGYPMFVLVPIFAIWNHSLLAAQLANAFLGAISILMCYAVAKEAGAGRIGKLCAALFFALYLPSWIYAEYLAKENLMTPLMLGALWCSLRLTKEVTYTTACISGVIFGLLALSGNAALSLGLAILVGLAFASSPLKQKLFALAIIALVSIAVVTPWAIRNYQVLGSPVLNTNGGFNLYLGNNPAATGLFVSIADTPLGPEWNSLRKTGEVQASDTLGREAVSWIKEHPARAIELAFKKAALFWTPPIHKGEGPGSKLETVIRGLWVVQFLLLAIGGIASILLHETRTRYVCVVWLGLIGYTMVHMLFYVIFRYREPIMPFLCLLAALSFESIWNRFTQSKLV